VIPFEIARAAQEDVQQILHFYRSPSASSDVFNFRLQQEIAYLRQWPFTGHRRRDLTSKDVCFWYFEPYFLVIHLQPGLLSIVAVLHASRNIARILKKRFTRLA
jgi:plasmid stabilization system protein ParE